jgi:hypothetical protein
LYENCYAILDCLSDHKPNSRCHCHSERSPEGNANGRAEHFGDARLGAVASAFSPNIWLLILVRVILGVGIGGDYPVSATIMSEYSIKIESGADGDLVFAM